MDIEHKIKIRSYQREDLDTIAKLFYDTVHTVNAKDYTKEQLDVWATGKIDLEAWDQSLCEHKTYIAILEHLIVGFLDLAEDGYLDRLYVHKDYQDQGIATLLCDQAEHFLLISQHKLSAIANYSLAIQTENKEQDKVLIYTHASITARPFFLKRGYQVINEQQVHRQGVVLTNYLMQKALS